MKKSMKKALAAVLCTVVLLSAAACKKEVDVSGLWVNATYTEDTRLGEGETEMSVEVKVEDKTVTFTILTDAETVGEALLDHRLIDGEMGQYGMYIKKVNGITADYDIDRSYWAFWINGEYAMSGVDTTPIDPKDRYCLEYSK